MTHIGMGQTTLAYHRTPCYASDMAMGIQKDPRIAAYVLWLEERGFVFPTVMSKAGGVADEPQQSAVEETTSQLLFVVDQVLTEEENELFSRIQVAMGLTASLAPLLQQSDVSSIKTAISKWRPQAIVLLGLEALKKAIAPTASFRQLSGRFFYCSERYGEIPFLSCFHPGDLLRSPSNKRKVWDDLQTAMTYVKTRLASQ